MKSLVLLSGGLDSTFNFFYELKAGQLKLALTFDYGQRAAAKEIAVTSQLCRENKVEHLIMELPFFRMLPGSSLLDDGKQIPLGDAVNIESTEQSQATMKSVWIPNRNGIFLNIAAGVAEARGIDLVLPGFNREEAATFPDNSEAYLVQLNQCFHYSTQDKVKVTCHSFGLDKAQIVKAFQTSLKRTPFQVWPCYQGLEAWCGECESCHRYARAIRVAGLEWADLQVQFREWQNL